MGKPERAPGGHGTYVQYTKIFCENRKAPHLVVEMVHTFSIQKFPVKTGKLGR